MSVIASQSCQTGCVGGTRIWPVASANKLSHPSEPMAFTPGMSEAILESVHAAIAEMFGDAAEGSSAGLEQQ
jgi:hypothetical protein